MNLFSSAKYRIITLKILQALFLIPIFKTTLHSPIQIINVALIVLLAINDYLRRTSNNPIKYASFILSNLIIGYFSYKTKTVSTTAYCTLLTIELVLLNNKISKSLLIINFIIYTISSNLIYSNNLFYTIQNILLNYGITVLICFLIKNIVMEKIKTEKLNTELKANNLKLKQYSNKIEEFTIAKERTRIAQELHDSIGHSLVALNMNLEYAENVVAIKPEKAKTTIQNCYTLSKDSLKTLRKAVSVLKETNNITNLRDDIEQIFINFKNTNTYKFNLDFDEQVEKFSREIKTCIFKILREAITNGIKHGNATSFNIHIYKLSNDIIFRIENNGKECKEIIPSNGIIGMKERVNLLNGEIYFNSEKKNSFIIYGKIPKNI
ncbi:sensor histidine kinase [Clostridium sp.]|jgi:signal transduction histidine kinase|uniref:sensor histidine kinase n=1 Tax=Clostridium sp. TaxID=1506 RepID=UPI0025832797|nr:sensor histidine kinase [Clostridium sp.]MDF2505209.1 hypothetical protein [Clostridium sp.]